MKRLAHAALIAIGVISAFPASLPAQPSEPQQAPAAAAARISACSLVPKEEVKQYLPWVSMFDSWPIEEEPIGAAGSSCNYPSVLIQVLPFSQRMIDIAREKGGLETVSGIGDEAYFHNNADQYAEVYVKAGEHLLTLQANLDGNMESVKPGVLNLATALVKQLR